MFCPNCRKEIQEGTKFCQYCGRQISDVPSGEIQNAAMQNRKILKAAICFLGAIGLLVAIIFCIKHNNSSNQFLVAIQEGDYESANQIFYQKIVNDYEQNLATEKLVTNDIENTVKDYYDGKITYTDAQERVEVYRNFFPTVVDEALVKITNLDDSRNNYITAKDYFDTGAYYAAWNYYSMVIEEDPNYSDACEMAEKSYEKYVGQLKYEIEELWKQEEYQQIIELCDNIISELKSKEVEWINNLRVEMEGVYVAQVLELVNVWLSNGGPELAEAIIEGVLASYPQNASLQEMKTIIREYYPVYLAQKFLTNSDMWGERSVPYFDTGGPYYDINGNSYENAYRYWTSPAYSKEEEIIYDTYTLNGEYTHFSAVLTPRSGWKDASNEGQTIFYIVGDGNVLYSAYMDKRSEVHTIDLDITNVKELKIGMNGGSYVDLLLAEPHIYKRYLAVEDVQNSIAQTSETLRTDVENIALLIFDDDSLFNSRIKVCNVLSRDQNSNELRTVNIKRDALFYLNTNENNQNCYGKFQHVDAEAIRSLNLTLDLDICNFIAIGKTGLAEIVNLLGGISYNVKEEDLQLINNNCESKLSSTGNISLNGEQVVALVMPVIGSKRSSDNQDEIDMQKEILSAISYKLSCIDTGNYNTVKDSLIQNMYTSMEADKAIELLHDYAGMEAVICFPGNDTSQMGSFGSHGSCIYSDDMIKEVQELHAFLYGDTNYEVSENVESISKEIEEFVSLNLRD